MTASPTLRVHDVLPASRSNGPGTRMVIWVQGCTLKCPGCFNPETHDARLGSEIEVTELAAMVREAAGSINGLTISGGEPLQQLDPVTQLVKQVRATTDLSMLVFTGYEPDEIARMPRAGELLKSIDVLISGRYQAPRRHGGEMLGSSNQVIRFLSDRYTDADMAAVPPSEILVASDGSIVATGIDPLGTRIDGTHVIRSS